MSDLKNVLKGMMLAGMIGSLAGPPPKPQTAKEFVNEIATAPRKSNIRKAKRRRQK